MTIAALCSPQGLLDMVAGPGGRRLHGRLPQGKSPSLEAAGFRQQDTHIDCRRACSVSREFNVHEIEILIIKLSICLNLNVRVGVFIFILSLLLYYRYFCTIITCVFIFICV